MTEMKNLQTLVILCLVFIVLILLWQNTSPRFQIIFLQTGNTREINNDLKSQHPSIQITHRNDSELSTILSKYLDVLLKSSNSITSNAKCDIGRRNELKFDCYPDGPTTQQKCEARGCCWNPVPNQKIISPDNFNSKANPESVPWCFYPQEFPGYIVGTSTQTKTGFKTKLSRDTKSYYPQDILSLEMDVIYETDSRLRIRIYDPSKNRYEVPLNTPKVTGAAVTRKYSVQVSDEGKPFNFIVQRQEVSADQPTVLINTTSAAPFMFADQYLQLSTFLPSKYIYGLGEHRGQLLKSVNWTRYTMWNKDQPPRENTNLYGTHPFYLVMEEDGNSHGVFLLNSNAMDVVLQPAPALTWRTIGGIIDMYVFLGPTPASVVQQYTEVIGHAFMPPYWSLGFHLCRWGYKTAERTMEIVKRVRDAGIPQDVQWNDIDYMDNKLDFTTGAAFGDQAKMVDELHSKGMHYVILVDPGISNEQKPGTYPPYDIGMALDIFVKDSKGNPAVGMVWPGYTVFPDFTNSKTVSYWTNMVKKFHDNVSFDGLWIDMNEVSNFMSGSVNKCPSNYIEYPPYLPAVEGGSLNGFTLCASSTQNYSIQYNVHNIYGLTETMASYEALMNVRGKRPFVISRSTYAGQGYYGGHWSGDNFATYDDMYFSIPEILSMNMFGISMVGADICGFQQNTTEQLCQRWHQLGAFYPFSRNHNTIGNRDQDPAAFSPAMAASTRQVYMIRYQLLPYLYLLFHKAHMMGETVVRPLFFEYPKDTKTYSIDKQFLWGECLMISPVLTKDTYKVDIYFPQGIWYDFYTGQEIVGNGTKMTMDAPIDKINLHMRGGYIIPMQEPALTTTESRKNKFSLLVALNATGSAEGGMFWDDGETIDTHSKGLFNMLWFQSKKNSLQSSVMKGGYTNETMTLGRVLVFGVKVQPKTVTINNKTAQFTYNAVNKVLSVIGLSVDMLHSINIQWA